MRQTLLLAFILIAAGVSYSGACSCQPTHSQTSYCSAEYVIIARVTKKTFTNDNRIAYKILVKREYKMSPRARGELAKGWLISAMDDSMCGVQLKVGHAYVIMGHSKRIGLCNFISEVSKLTIVQKRGIFGAYKQGCACTVMPCFRMGHCEREEGECLWDPFNKCQTNYGSCIPARGAFDAQGNPTRCHWRRSSPFNTCNMRSRSSNNV